MADVITRFKVESAEYDRKIGQSKNKLKEFEKSGGDASRALQDFTGKLGLNIGKLGAMGVTIGATTAALAIAKDAFSQSESAIDEWGRMTSSAKGAYDMFLQSINTGNWSNFLQRLQDAITGARNLYDSLDRLGSIKSNNQAAIAITQQSIQQLRLRQQNGENVTDELAAATERLAKLQRQEVEAGITAGTNQMVQTLKNAGISEAMAKQAADEIAKGGQDVFDKYAQMVKDLEKEGTGKGHAVSKLGGIIKYYEEGSFGIANLNEEQKKMYQLAKAITERETTLQQGIATYAQAVQQGIASAREEFKNTKYGSSGKGGSGGGKPTEEIVAGTIADYQQQITVLNKTILNATDQEARESALRMVERYTNEIKRMKGETSSIADMAMPDKPFFSTTDLSKLQLNPSGLKYAQEQQADKVARKELKAEGSKELKDGLMGITSGLEQLGVDFGEGFNNFLEKVQGVMTIIQGIQTVVSAFQLFSAANDTTQSALLSEIAVNTAITAGGSWIPFFTNGGKVPRAANGYGYNGLIGGNSYSGDNQLIAVNAGEYVFNRAQLGNLASQLQGTAQKTQIIKVEIENNKLVGTLNNAEKRGQYTA